MEHEFLEAASFRPYSAKEIDVRGRSSVPREQLYETFFVIMKLLPIASVPDKAKRRPIYLSSMRVRGLQFL